MTQLRHLILYDGVCALCNWLARFVLPRDRKDWFRYAPLQGETARGFLRTYGKNPDDLDTFYVIADYETGAPSMLDRDRAALFVLARLGFPWNLAVVFRIIPRFLRRPLYNLVARRRYKWFGKYDSCPLPAQEVRHKFLP